VALLIPNLQMGGSERNIVLLGEALAEAGYEVEVWLTGSDSRELSTALTVVPVNGASDKPGRLVTILRRVQGIRARMRCFRPDCMISFLESSNIPAVLAGMFERVPTVVSVRGNPQRFNWFYRVMTFLFYRFARSVVLPSREVANYLAHHYLLRNTVCIANLQERMIHGDAAPGGKQHGPMIAVGRLVPGKKFEDVIELAGLLLPGRELVIVGDGPERARLEAVAAGARTPVRFLGSLPHRETMAALGEASVLLSMSASECWPNVIAEALSAGTPVVARDCDYGPREMIVDGENGFLVQEARDASVRPAIRAALEDHAAYQKLCEKARASARAWSRENIRALWVVQITGVTA
jgi:GalNAc-alpha-(1->4)-GalNAc-alpha-(1->3)-diNAcBac-PP-undecaprenol alpha-1,4-N-acetyl-D-galactosaminyltransferase